MSKKKNKANNSATKKMQEPIGNRIAKAVYEAKKISERIVGYISYEIKFVRATYDGKTQRPAKITAIEKGIVGILLVDESASFEKIGTILGLDVVHDKAEQSILRNAIDILKGFSAIEGDDSCYALTDAGRVYADKGERPDTYTKSFDIFVDVNHPSWLNIKNGIGYSYKSIVEINTPCADINLDLEQIKAYAENQAQDVHFPQNRYLLESATWHVGHEASYKVHVCFVQNVADSDDIRVFVYDENSNTLNDIFAQYINKDSSLKEELLNNCIHYEIENNEDTIILHGEDIEIAKSEITEELKEAEQKIIQEENGELEATDEEVEKNSEFEEKQSSNTVISKSKERLHKKALYDSLSFEVELQKIFTEDEPDEIWLISPWIRKGAFLHDRGPLIENFLKDENKRVFIAYSEPASNNDGKPMVDEEVEPGIKQLEDQYPNFYYVQLPEFHLKNVIEVKGDQKILFSGSFNVLSFSVSDQKTHVRREEMALAHHNVAKKKYLDCQLEFARIYANRIMKEIEQLDSDSILNYRNERLDYFLNIDNTEIHKLLIPVEDLLEEKKLERIKKNLSKKLALVGRDLVAASNKGVMSPKERKKYKSLLDELNKALNENAIDDPSIIELFENNQKLLDIIPDIKIFPGKGLKGNDVTQRNRTEVRENISGTGNGSSLSELKKKIDKLMDGSKRGRRIQNEDLITARQMLSPNNMSLDNEEKIFKVLAGTTVLSCAIKYKIEKRMKLADVHNSLRRIIKKSNDFAALSIIYDTTYKRIIFDFGGIQFQFEQFKLSEELQEIVNSHSNLVSKWNGSKTFLYPSEILELANNFNFE